MLACAFVCVHVRVSVRVRAHVCVKERCGAQSVRLSECAPKLGLRRRAPLRSAPAPFPPDRTPPTGQPASKQEQLKRKL